MQKVKKIIRCGYEYGEIGKVVPKESYNGVFDLRVGDIVSLTYFNKLLVKPIMHDVKYNTYGIHGLGVNDLDYTDLKKVLSYNHLTEEIIIELQQDDSFELQEMEVKELTMEELIEIVGYDFKIKE